ncbi:c-type cytochrome [Roseomonas stagni]|uniref:C-type cytochrome n=1 Tax=Falsiroseomonas algicola TaxID=2716930 RepID=A0A6M1LIW0_9PROT|nr:c-type cytochrome [Falsiroseomonas algicola]NGM20092.1 c-type cytochrome [Falsiroseomonas algicola]
MRLLPLLVLLLVAGCGGDQSSLDPTGPNARDTLWLFKLTLWVSVIVCAMVALAVVQAWLLPRFRLGARPTLWMVAGGGVVLPAIVLPLLLVASLRIPWPFAEEREGAFTIDVVAWQFWWEFRYPNPVPGGPPVVTANELHIPVGVPVRFRLLTEDVIHSFWIPTLGGKVDMIPGRTNYALLRADAPGEFRGACFEFCGLQHANMAFTVRALPQAEWQDWMWREARPAAEPEGDEARKGREIFTAAGCGSCHAVRGHGAEGATAPDLTHLASRRTIGAGILPNTRSSLTGWIAATQQIKPGANMPSYNGLTGPQLHALAAYLEGLR